MGNYTLIEKHGAVAIIFLNQPESLNALSPELRDDLLIQLQNMEQDDSVRVIVIAGKGKTFCAGGNVKVMADTKAQITVHKNMGKLSKVIKRIREIEKPVVAAVHGYAIGAGFSIVLACDIVIAEEDARFSLAFKNVGLSPDLGAHYFLAQAFGPWKAKELIWTGANLTASEGEKYGFVNRIVATGHACREALQLAVELSEGPVNAFQHSKMIMNQLSKSMLHSILDMENYASALLRNTNDHQEGLQAFMEKRKPVFKGE